MMDGAGWHTDGTAFAFDNITLVRLPAYSPELNPVEQIWQWLRQNELANKCFKGYEDIVNSCCDAWNRFVSDSERVKGLCMREWMDWGL
jgi:transposase